MFFLFTAATFLCNLTVLQSEKMGKIRSAKKSRVHLKASNLTTPIIKKEQDLENDFQGQDHHGQTKEGCLIPLNHNPFSGMQISLDSLIKQKLVEPLTIPVKDTDENKISRNNGYQKSSKKKDKIKQKRDAFIKKLSASQAAVVSQTKAKARSRTPVVGDLLQLKEALQAIPETKPQNTRELENIIHQSPSSRLKSPLNQPFSTEFPRSKPTTESSRRKPMKQRARQRHAIDEIAKFKERLHTDAFKSDPKQFILENMRRNL